MIGDPELTSTLDALFAFFVGKALIPRESEVADTYQMPANIIGGKRDMGVFGLTIPATVAPWTWLWRRSC
jgi:acyl-CoA dehydrogenase